MAHDYLALYHRLLASSAERIDPKLRTVPVAERLAQAAD
jgi:hypothetical protein